MLKGTPRIFRYFDDKCVVTYFDHLSQNQRDNVSDQLEYTQVPGNLIYLMNYTKENIVIHIVYVVSFSI